MLRIILYNENILIYAHKVTMHAPSVIIDFGFPRNNNETVINVKFEVHLPKSKYIQKFCRYSLSTILSGIINSSCRVDLQNTYSSHFTYLREAPSYLIVLYWKEKPQSLFLCLINHPSNLEKD